MPDLIPWPFPLPDRFVDTLGYPRVVEAFDSPALRDRLAELLRRQGIDAGAAPPTGPRRYVALWWEPAGDELAFTDGVRSGVGQLDHWAWLDYLRGNFTARAAPLAGRPIYGWLAEYQVDLGSSDAPATHALIVDGVSYEAWAVPIALARQIVREQSLAQDQQP